VDYDVPCAAVHVTSENNLFRVCLDEGLDDARVFQFHVEPGEYPLSNLLAVVADRLSQDLGLTTALYDPASGTVRVQATVPQPGLNVFSGLTYRVRVSDSTSPDTLSPKVGDGPSLNLLLGFTPEADPAGCTAGSACAQIAPSPPVLTFAAASELWGV
jgi:hypothetical protein